MNYHVPFEDNKWEFPTVAFSSELVERAFESERLRGNFGLGSTPQSVLFELHSLFQLLMSVVSARIEGNRTTVYDALRGVDEQRRSFPTPNESHREIQNLFEAMSFIDALDPGVPLTHVFIKELHRISVDGLIREGDPTPGHYRAVDVGISQSNHAPPSHLHLQAEMNELVDFMDRPVTTAEQMIHVAMAHHRFLWIHPFRNGNGRVSRLLSYAMLRRHGFVSPIGLRTVNPIAVFGNDRDGYYSSLALADDLTNDGTVAWCTFFVRGIHDDMDRLTKLQDFDFVLDQLFGPALDRLVQSGAATLRERNAMHIALQREVVKAGDLVNALPGTPSQRSVAIHGMVDRGLLVQDSRGPRFYRVPISAPPFGNFIVRQLDVLGLLPTILKDDSI